MFALAGNPSLAGSLLNWSRLFALQPEPDLEFTEEELEQTSQIRSTSPMKRPKKPGGRLVLWIVLLALAGGAIYVAMEPEIITDVLGPLLGEEPLSTPPSASVKPVPTLRTPAAQPDAAGAPATPPPLIVPAQPSPAPAPTAAIPAPAPGPAQTVPSAPKPSIPAAPPIASSPIPMFGEGQKVTVSLDPAIPGDTVTLSLDPAGTKPGATVRPGATLTVLDGDLQGSGWVYSVRSDDGAKGWVPERRLRLKP